MRLPGFISLLLGTGLAVFGQAPATPGQQTELVNKYCVGCHNERLKTGGVVLEKLDLANVDANAKVWEKAVRKVRAGSMPPQGLPRPDQKTLDAFAGYLENSLDRAA